MLTPLGLLENVMKTYIIAGIGRSSSCFNCSQLKLDGTDADLWRIAYYEGVLDLLHEADGCTFPRPSSGVTLFGDAWVSVGQADECALEADDAVVGYAELLTPSFGVYTPDAVSGPLTDVGWRYVSDDGRWGVDCSASGVMELILWPRDLTDPTKLVEARVFVDAVRNSMGEEGWESDGLDVGEVAS